MTSFRTWLTYLAIWPGMPIRESKLPVSRVLVFAFGRNRFADSHLSEVFALRHNRDSDAGGFVQLRELAFDPGDQNRKLKWFGQIIVGEPSREWSYHVGGGTGQHRRDAAHRFKQPSYYCAQAADGACLPSLCLPNSRTPRVGARKQCDCHSTAGDSGL